MYLESTCRKSVVLSWQGRMFEGEVERRARGLYLVIGGGVTLPVNGTPITLNPKDGASEPWVVRLHAIRNAVAYGLTRYRISSLRHAIVSGAEQSRAWGRRPADWSHSG